ncbi:hypothetical protein [Aurantivibrio infirmus]
MNGFIIKIGIVIYSLAIANLIFANENAVSPARFFENGEELLSKMDFPEDSFDGTVIVRGAADISRGGRSTTLVFYSDSNNRGIFKPYENAIRKAFGRRLKVAPAIVNGKKKRVWFNFSVVFENNQGSKSISIHQNLLYNTDSYGRNYIDPQRYDFEPFPDNCRRKSFREPAMVWAAANIDEYGNPTAPRIVAGEASDSCKRTLIELLLNSSFIPAMHGDKFVSANYVEAWFTSY